MSFGMCMTRVCAIRNAFVFILVSIFGHCLLHAFTHFDTHTSGRARDGEREQKLLFNDEMLHVIVHSSLNVSGEQLTDFRCLLFILFHIFRFAFVFFFSSLFGISRRDIWFFPLFSCCVRACVFFFGECVSLKSFVQNVHWWRIHFYLHYMIFFIFYVALSFHSCLCAVVAAAAVFLIIAAHHHFYGAKFVVIAHIKHTHADGEGGDLHLYCHHTTLNMLCTAFHHNLWIWIRSSKKGRGITHTHNTYIDYNLLEWIWQTKPNTASEK